MVRHHIKKLNIVCNGGKEKIDAQDLKLDATIDANNDDSMGSTLSETYISSFMREWIGPI